MPKGERGDVGAWGYRFSVGLFTGGCVIVYSSVHCEHSSSDGLRLLRRKFVGGALCVCAPSRSYEIPIEKARFRV